jgi:Protein of unknown function (DUF3014)
MNDLPDHELQRPPTEAPRPTPPPTHPAGLWSAIALLVAAGVAAAYFAFGWRARPALPPTTTPSPQATVNEPPLSLGGRGEPVAIPPLDASDALVRTLARALSANPAVTAWLTTNGLIRNFAVVVANVADGAAPARHLTVLRPSSALRVVERDRGSYLDPRSYDRYAFIADAVASVDPAGAAKLYATLKPRIEEAHRELGSPDRSFDRTLERAIVVILDTPSLDGRVRLKPKGIGYAYGDERLEGLTSAQKQLLRMGPRNGRIIKGRLREIALALGIPPTHLPAR